MSLVASVRITVSEMVIRDIPVKPTQSSRIHGAVPRTCQESSTPNESIHPSGACMESAWPKHPNVIQHILIARLVITQTLHHFTDETAVCCATDK